MVPGVRQCYSSRLSGVGAQIRSAKMPPSRRHQLIALLLSPLPRFRAACRETLVPYMFYMARYLRACGPRTRDLSGLLASRFLARASPSSGGRPHSQCRALYAPLYATRRGARCYITRWHPGRCPPRVRLEICYIQALSRNVRGRSYGNV